LTLVGCNGVIAVAFNRDMDRTRRAAAGAVDKEIADDPVEKGGRFAQTFSRPGSEETRERVVQEVVRLLA
jgi:hypothetical protein